MTSASIKGRTVSRDPIILVSAADDRYAMPLAAMLKSVAANLGAGRTVSVYVMDGGIKVANKRKLVAPLGDAFDVHWTKPPIALTQDLPVFGHVSVGTYFRLLIPDLLPATVEKAIYLDADTLVLSDLGLLWDQDMGTKPLLAVQDGSNCLASEVGVSVYRELGLPGDAKTLNGGVLVIHVRQWREEHIHTKILDFLKTHRDRIKFWDQDGLNAVLATRWGEIERKWNYRVDCAQAPVPGCDTPADLERQAAIIHFASAAKPWHYFSEHPAKALFFKYLDQTAWAGWRPRPPLRALLNKHYWGALCRTLPLVGPVWKRIRSGQSSRTPAQAPTTKHQPPSTKH